MLNTKRQADRRTAIFLKIVGIALLGVVLLMLLAQLGNEFTNTSTLPSIDLRTATPFKQEAARVTEALNCSNAHITRNAGGLGALYSCIAGPAQTVKFFINEVEDAGQIENVKLMWNDWTSNIGYGIHADKRQARAFVRAFASLYAPQLKTALLTAFFSRKNEAFETEQYGIAYTYHQGSAIGEHLLTLAPKAVSPAD